MRKPCTNRNDRLPVKRKALSCPEVRQRVVEGLVASSTADFVALVRWLTTGKNAGEALPLEKCESLRNSIAHLESLKCGVQTDWKNALRLMEKAIQQSHKVKEIAPAPSRIVAGVLNNLKEISQKISSGTATPEMLVRLKHMQQITSGIQGSEKLAKSINEVLESAQNALRGYTRQQVKPEQRKPVKPDATLRDDRMFRTECEPLTGLKDIFIIADCFIAMSARLGCSPVSLAKRAAALKGVIRPGIMPELLELLQQEVDLTSGAAPSMVKDDNTRSDGGKLVGLTGIVEGGSSLGVEARRVITAELKKHSPLTSVQRLSLDTALTALALERDPFSAIEEIKRIAASLNWRPLAVACHAAHKFPGIRPEIAGDVITLLAQDEALSEKNKGHDHTA